MNARPYVLAEITYRAAREQRYDGALLPWGATEAHNLHLPYATDSVESEGIAVEAARLAWERGARAIGRYNLASARRRRLQSARRLQARGVVAERAADSDDADHPRSISSFKKCVEQEMHGS